MEMEFKFRGNTARLGADKESIENCGRHQAEGKCRLQNTEEPAQFVDGQADPRICRDCLQNILQVQTNVR